MPYDLPSWLQADAPSEPFKALLAGVQAGSGIAANRNQANANAERAREFDIQAERQMRMDVLAQTLQEQHMRLNEIHITNEIRSRQEQIDSERAYTDVASLYSRHQALGIAGTDGSEAAIGYKIANSPSFYLHPGSKSLLADMLMSRKTRDVATQKELDAAAYQQRIETQQAGLADRTEMLVEGRQNVEDKRSETQLKAAFIRAEASARSILNTKEFQSYMLRKNAIQNDIRLSLDRKFEEADKLDKEYGIVPKTDAGNPVDQPAVAPAPLAPAGDPMPRSQEEFDALPSGTWFINPADGRRMKKK
jgi:hypothetical protein